MTVSDRMLKESKKLQRTIESLTKKNATLQKKLDNASDSGASSSSTAAPPGVDLAQGMRTFVPVNLDDDFDHKLRLDADEYPLGLALAQEVLDRRGVL